MTLTDIKTMAQKLIVLKRCAVNVGVHEDHIKSKESKSTHQVTSVSASLFEAFHLGSSNMVRGTCRPIVKARYV